MGLRGQLLVEALDKYWGSCWHHGIEFQFYSRCKVIINEIKYLVTKEREAINAINSLEE